MQLLIFTREIKNTKMWEKYFGWRKCTQIYTHTDSLFVIYKKQSYIWRITLINL